MEQSLKGSKIMFHSQQLALPVGPVFVSLFGHQRRMIEDEGRCASRLAVELGAQTSKVCRVIVASNQNQPGFQQILIPDPQSDFTYGDGVVIKEPGSSAVLQSADCPILILYDSNTKRVVVAHAGRPALTPFCKESSGNCDVTIVENALHAVTAGGKKHAVYALVIPGICGHHFKHDRPEAAPFIEPFLPLGSIAFDNMDTGALNLSSIIRHRLAHAGVAYENIKEAGPCTFETTSLSSHRRGDTDRNTIVVVWR